MDVWNATRGGQLMTQQTERPGKPETEPKKVVFCVAGAQKSGTTALRHFLLQHPDIGLPNIAEPHFFDRPTPPLPGDYAGYHRLFRAGALARTAGDITPSYLYIRSALPALHRYNPAMKIIVLLRNPVHRAYSHWAMLSQLGNEPRGFLAAMLNESLHYARYGQDRYVSYVQRGFYHHQITRLFSLFPPEQCLILRNRDLRGIHAQTLQKIFGFLGVSRIDPPEPEVVHTRSYPPIPPAADRMLRLLYRRDITRLETLLGWDCSDWK